MRGLQRGFISLNRRLRDQRDPLIDEVVGNMLAAYAYVDDLLEQETDLFAPGNSRCWIDLNSLTLSGQDSAANRASGHLHATEEHFYGEQSGGIGDVVGWYGRHLGDGVWGRAAGLYVRMLSEPQLFLEGNHRCGILLASYLLAREGLPPVVVTAECARAFFDVSSTVKQVHKHSFSMLFRMPAFRRELIGLFEHEANPAYLR